MFVTMRAYGTPLSCVEVMNNSKLLNNAFRKALPWVDILDRFRAVISYDRTFVECYPIPINEARLYNVRRDMYYANFNPRVKPTVYKR